MLFSIVENGREKIARHKIAHRFAIRNGLLATGLRRLLKFYITAQNFGNVFANEQLVQILKIRQTIKHKNTLNQLVRMFHFANRLLIFTLSQFFKSPVLVHSGVQKRASELEHFSARLHKERARSYPCKPLEIL